MSEQSKKEMTNKQLAIVLILGFSFMCLAAYVQALASL